MKTQFFQNKIKDIHREILADVSSLLRGEETVNLIHDEDAPKVNCTVRLYEGGPNPARLTVTAVRPGADGLPELYCEDGGWHSSARLYGPDIIKLHKAVEQVCGKTTPAAFRRLLDRCENFPVALHDIMDRNGWEDLTAEEDSNAVCRIPAAGILIAFGPDGKTRSLKTA